MATLSFDGAVNIAVDIVAKQFQGTQLYEADGLPSSGSAMKATDIDKLRVVFYYPQNRTIIMNSTVWGEFAKPQVIDSPWLEDQVIAWPVKLDLPAALEKLRASGYTGAFANVTLRKPLYPGVNQPYFIFGTPTGYIFVGCNDGSVSHQQRAA